MAEFKKMWTEEEIKEAVGITDDSFRFTTGTGNNRLNFKIDAEDGLIYRDYGGEGGLEVSDGTLILDFNNYKGISISSEYGEISLWENSTHKSVKISFNSSTGILLISISYKNRRRQSQATSKRRQFLLYRKQIPVSGVLQGSRRQDRQACGIQTDCDKLTRLRQVSDVNEQILIALYTLYKLSVEREYHLNHKAA